ncbi:MAG: hydrogenase nickel incorporation protein HypA [Opitutae bacterium]|nr:hydrogenase nickel incorporation protein HypA [Opitutae bacterium]MCD8298249.1 hydrogenase nickel incorporation protein HypA [Opitutae bacterium]
MFDVGIDVFFAAIIGIALVLFLLVGFFYNRRDRLTQDHLRITTVFYCIRCGEIYSRPRSREVAACPKCGLKNTRLKF